MKLESRSVGMGSFEQPTIASNLQATEMVVAEIVNLEQGESIGCAGLQAFERIADRKRLSPTALKAFRLLAVKWSLLDSEAVALLGVSDNAWKAMLDRDSGKTLSEDQLTRVSALLGIYKGLHTVFTEAMADRWLQLINTNPLFRGRSPIAAMIEEGYALMRETRSQVEAMGQGI
ncbi:DUF2384 domain-containing protein [Sphingomonas sp.]|jgi:hypothetical protein|uniref:DUF2384 domain-containing protein n=1 Tax=Sphingomonas sp. TaxID=28214 RepID=UPI00261823D8|nr:DUF2384 domain-containing protein [Sphingomonas sp.]